MTDAIFEIAEIEIIPGQEAEFEAGVARAAPAFKTSKGCLSLALQRSIETPSRYQLVVGWESVEDHMDHFRASPNFQVWRGEVSAYFAAPPVVGHVRRVMTAF